MPNTGLRSKGVTPEKTAEVIELRPKRAFRGRAFVGFGNLVPCLHGKSIFPLPPKQEKLYFNVATDSVLDHFDGELDPSYQDDIKKHMKLVMDSMRPERQRLGTFLTRAENKFFNQEWRVKFPFASHRLSEYNSAHSEVIDIEKSVGGYYSPEMYPNATRNMPLALMSGISQSHGGVKSDKVEVLNIAQLELRKAETSLQNIFDAVERPGATSDFQLRYEKYQNKVAHYLKAGERWTKPKNSLNKIRELKQLDNYNQFESWLLTDKESPDDLNMFHEAWLGTGLANRLINPTQAVRIGHWTTTFFQYANFKENRPVVSNLKNVFSVFDDFSIRDLTS